MSDAQKIYELVGPLLSRREVAQDLGAPVWDDDDTVAALPPVV